VIGAVVVLLAMLSLLTWQLVVLEDSRGHIAAQDSKVTRLLRGSEPVLREARPAVNDADVLLRAAMPVVRGARPIVESLRALDGTRLSATIGVVGRLAAELASGDRLTRTVDQTSALLNALTRAGFTDRVVRAADLVPYIAQIQAETLSVQRRSLDVQATTLATQRRALRVLLRSLAIQREALKHVRSIDRKTGGQVPPAARVP
jgi:hypothetical protein